jgi:uncharacterized damage-inducible protein DinB
VLAMARSLMADAFAHHTWATLRLIDACADLSEGQLASAVPGTYGSIEATLRHLVGADAWYLFDLDGDPAHRVEAEGMDLAALRTVVGADVAGWAEFLERDPDVDTMVTEVDEDDGFRRDAPIGVRLAQALHHGTDHRSQICTGLTALGIEPPNIDVWTFATASGRSTESMP